MGKIVDITSLKDYLNKGIRECVNKNIENDYIDIDDYEQFCETLKSKILVIDKLNEESKKDLLSVVGYILNLSQFSDLVKYEMIISLPMLYNSFNIFHTFTLKYKSVISSASFMIEIEDVYEFCKVFLEIEYMESLESTYPDFEDQVNFCGDVIEMIFNNKEYTMSNEENDRLLKEVLENLRSKYIEMHMKSEENNKK